MATRAEIRAKRAVQHLAAEAVPELSRRFGVLIRERRRRLEMTQAELAEACGVGRRFLIDLEAGKSSVQLGKALLVAEGLGLGAAEWLGR